jgi:hypothetical protein
MKVLLLNEIRTANMVLYINRGRKERNESFLYKCWKACEQAPPVSLSLSSLLHREGHTGLKSWKIPWYGCPDGDQSIVRAAV